jgi:hypothetical protein
MCRARLAWRSPPGLRRWRACLPEAMVIGLAPHSAAKELSLWIRLMFCPAVSRTWPACPVEIPSSAVVRGAAVATNGASCASSSMISLVRIAIRRARLRSANFAAFVGFLSAPWSGRRRAQRAALPVSVFRAASCSRSPHSCRVAGACVREAG